MNILIVDDEIDQLQTLRRGLKNKGYGVFEALGMPEALEILENNHQSIDLVLTDHVMPGKSGLDLLKEIRSTYSAIPVVVMTAYGRRELALKVMGDGFDGFLEKPFTIHQLLQEIEKVMKDHQKQSMDWSLIGQKRKH